MSEYGMRGVREEDDDEDYRPERSRDRSSSGGGGGGHGKEKLQRLDSIQDPGKRYSLRDCIGSGVCGDVYEAVDEEAGRKVAIKIQTLTPETQPLIVEEYRVLRDFSSHPNLPDFYGVYRRRSGKKTDYDQIWFVIELCEGGPVVSLVQGLRITDKRIREEHIAYILRETIKAVMHLHENNVLHRDIRASNIMLTKEGEVRLVDFGLARIIKGEAGRRQTCIGSPNWMAPEVVTSKSEHGPGYGSRADVWAIGITAIELADGKPPFEDMHPTRALFQIVRNPPPTLYRPANWSQNLNDFIAECLEKNPDNRPCIAEIVEHPFLSELPENDYPLTQEIKSLVLSTSEKGKKLKKPEFIVRKGYLKSHQTQPPERMHQEDLAALEVLTEDRILDELQERLRTGSFHTFVGDVLLILNPNEDQDIYGPCYHAKYQNKSRSDNSPHIYSIADSAYQNVLHHEEPQHILFAGESNSGKTTNMMHLMEHLMYLGKSLKDIGARVIKAMDLLHSFTNAATPLNINSTRCVNQIQTTYGSSGKASGAIFWVYQLEKFRVSTRDRNQSNFHIFYYFYDGLEAAGNLRQYLLPQGRRMRYLRVYESESISGRKRSFKVRNDPYGNARKFEHVKECLKALELEEHCETIWRTLAAILNLGDVRFIEGNGGEAEVHNIETAKSVAELLNVDLKKFTWSLCNYCVIKKGTAVRRRNNCDEAKEARDVLANTIYQRLVDWIVNQINEKFSVSRTLFGDKFLINILDLFGFECFSKNKLEQLVVNTMNEQLQCHYNQRIFVWEMQEQEEEEIPIERFHFYDNKQAVDQLMAKDDGLFFILDEAARQLQDTAYIFDRVSNRKADSTHVNIQSEHEFAVAHYTGKLLYDANEIAEKTRDFVPPEMIETLRLSSQATVSELFTNKLTKGGALTILSRDSPKDKNKQQQQNRRTAKSKWGAALLQSEQTTNLRKYNTASRGQYSQTRKIRTYAATFRASSLEILKNLSVGAAGGGTHFVRCIRSDLEGTPRGFYREVVRQQIRALAVLDTARARQKGYPCRISFQEFLRRYKFLAFDFDENVEMTQDNCRLLMIRLKMEGWLIGRTKVFLRYYNEEYLSRLYETQVKKIIKVQCMLRAFLARKTVAMKSTKNKFGQDKEAVKKVPTKPDSSQRPKSEKSSTSTEIMQDMSQEEAALVLQKAYRGHQVRKETGTLLSKDPNWDQNTMDMMRFYCSKWRSKTIFQVLLHYRAARYQDLVQFCQQVHLYNQATVGALQMSNERVPLERIDPHENPDAFLGPAPLLTVHKLPFNFHTELPFYDTSHMHDPSKARRRQGSITSSVSDDEQENWDEPLRRQTIWGNIRRNKKDVQCQTTNSPHRAINTASAGDQSLINTPFSRDPSVPVRCPPAEVQAQAQAQAQSRAISSFQPPIDGRNPVQPANAHTSRSNNYNKVGHTGSRKKVPPPPIPVNKVQLQPTQTRNYSNYNSTARNKNETNDNWATEDRINSNTFNYQRVNPIHELRMIGQQNNNDDTGDEPPFNFQAMLRKTTHQRNSMKRTPVFDAYGSSESSGFHSARKATPESNVVYSSNGNKSVSPEWSPNEMVRMSEKYGRERAWSDGNETVAVASVTTLLAPGITVEGYVADL
ncbi:PREDICTED: neither inactivation nor afterpotential protein C [Ceratosolen solmsi marchali]|uniref:non-specific serine/threonine protein kinase n=1 Tax=Ceratosolen solmsi marchali TaxID=326594 RepID=A0AAJ7DXZ9_9HYME|nr:PREDICTED: neither inactivation nor afterpotential protein C [Ceratosolen solmsi marchali]